MDEDGYAATADMGAQARKAMLAAGAAGSLRSKPPPQESPPQRSGYSRFRAVSAATDVAKGAAAVEHAEAAAAAAAAGRPVSVDGGRHRYNRGLRFDDPRAGAKAAEDQHMTRHMTQPSSGTETEAAYEPVRKDGPGGVTDAPCLAPTTLASATGSAGSTQGGPRSRDPYSQANFDLSDSGAAAPPVAMRTLRVKKRPETYLSPAKLAASESEPDYASGVAPPVAARTLRAKKRPESSPYLSPAKLAASESEPEYASLGTMTSTSISTRISSLGSHQRCVRSALPHGPHSLHHVARASCCDCAVTAVTVLWLCCDYAVTVLWLCCDSAVSHGLHHAARSFVSLPLC